MIRGLVRAGAIGAVALGILAPAASANTFKVTRTTDSAPNGCGRGGCTLREAVLAANNAGGADTIVLEGGKKYDVKLTGGDDTGASGDLDLTGPTFVKSGGKNAELNSSTSVSPLFEAFAKARFEGLTFKGGASITAGEVPVRISGSTFSKIDTIAVFVRGPLSVSRTRFEKLGSNALWQDGPGGVTVKSSVFDDLGSNAINEYLDGGVSIKGSKFSRSGSNIVFESGAGDIAFVNSKSERAQSNAFNEYEGGSVVIRNSSLDRTGSNVVFEAGTGSIELERSRIVKPGSTAFRETDEGNVVLSRTRFTQKDGDAIYESEDGDVIIERSQVKPGSQGVNQRDGGKVAILRSSVSGAGDVGVLVDGGRVTVSRSKIERNGYGGLDSLGPAQFVIDKSSISDNKKPANGAGLEVNSGSTAMITDSTFAGNRGEYGGAIYSEGTMTIQNSTLYGNKAAADGGAMDVEAPASTNLKSVTMTRNRASQFVGGIVVNSPMSFRNSFIADNDAGLQYDECYSSTGVSVEGTNLLGQVGECGALGTGSDLAKPKAKTEKLAANGGPTRTAALPGGSPAVGAASANSPARDQRGRKRDSKPDIGAFER